MNNRYSAKRQEVHQLSISQFLAALWRARMYSAWAQREKTKKGELAGWCKMPPPHSLTKAVSSIQSNGDHRTFLHVALFLNTSAVGWQNNARNEGYAAYEPGRSTKNPSKMAQQHIDTNEPINPLISLPPRPPSLQFERLVHLLNQESEIGGASCIFLSWDEYCTSPCRVASTWCCCVHQQPERFDPGELAYPILRHCWWWIFFFPGWGCASCLTCHPKYYSIWSHLEQAFHNLPHEAYKNHGASDKVYRMQVYKQDSDFLMGFDMIRS